MLNRDFREFVQLLNENRVRFLIVGGYAVAYHGYPRYTKDLDIWIWVEPRNAIRIVRTLEQFGLGSLGLSVNDFLEADQIIQIGYPPARIDLMTTVEGVQFEDCYPARVEAEIDGLTLPFIDLQNLRKNKLASGRYQDLADLERLDE